MRLNLTLSNESYHSPSFTTELLDYSANWGGSYPPTPIWLKNLASKSLPSFRLVIVALRMCQPDVLI